MATETSVTFPPQALPGDDDQAFEACLTANGIDPSILEDHEFYGIKSVWIAGGSPAGESPTFATYLKSLVDAFRRFDGIKEVHIAALSALSGKVEIDSASKIVNEAITAGWSPETLRKEMTSKLGIKFVD